MVRERRTDLRGPTSTLEVVKYDKLIFAVMLWEYTFFLLGNDDGGERNLHATFHDKSEHLQPVTRFLCIGPPGGDTLPPPVRLPDGRPGGSSPRTLSHENSAPRRLLPPFDDTCLLVVASYATNSIRVTSAGSCDATFNKAAVGSDKLFRLIIKSSMEVMFSFIVAL